MPTIKLMKTVIKSRSQGDSEVWQEGRLRTDERMWVKMEVREEVSYGDGPALKNESIISCFLCVFTLFCRNISRSYHCWLERRAALLKHRHRSLNRLYKISVKYKGTHCMYTLWNAKQIEQRRYEMPLIYRLVGQFNEGLTHGTQQCLEHLTHNIDVWYIFLRFT